MITNHYQAADEILDKFMLPWLALGNPIATPNVPFVLPSNNVTWARWQLVYSDGGQSTLAGPDGQSRFNKSGSVIIELFTPLGSGLKSAYEAAQIALDAYEGERTPSDVWFRDVRITDEGGGRGGEAAWWSTTVTANFIYDNRN